jgi:hypothetical protein
MVCDCAQATCVPSGETVTEVIVWICMAGSGVQEGCLWAKASAPDRSRRAVDRLSAVRLTTKGGRNRSGEGGRAAPSLGHLRR